MIPPMATASRLLLVDDDRALASVLAAAFEEEGLSVLLAHDGKEGLRQFHAEKPDIVVLDVLMPEMDGLEVCRRIRAVSRVPVLLLTSRGEEVDRVTGLDTGADDYVTKPFSTRELCARLRALLRRAELPVSSTQLPAPPNDLVGPTQGSGGRGPLQIDAARFEVRWQQRVVALTRSEFLVLRALAQTPGTVLSRDRLIDVARGEDVVVTERSVDSFVKRIRKKFREADEAFDAIETVVGVGYRLREL